MKKNFLKIVTVVILLSICLIIYLTRANNPEYDIIDITGNNGVWSASLNINIGYSNHLFITPATDKFELPPEMIIEVFVKDKSIYADRLKIIKKDNFQDYGEYKCKFDSNKYLEKNYNDVYILISYKDETSKVDLNMISYP